MRERESQTETQRKLGREGTSPHASIAAICSGMSGLGTATRQVETPSGRGGGGRQTEREAMMTPSSARAVATGRGGIPCVW